MASASQRSISTIRHAPVMVIAAPPGPWTSTRTATGRVSSCGAKTPSVPPTGHAGSSIVMPGLWIDPLAPEAVRIHQGTKTIVVAASPELLRAEDERMAGDAEAALGSLTWDRGAAGHHPAWAAGVAVARAAAQVADGSEASCTSPLRWGGCWSWSGCPATRRSAVGPGPARCCRPTRAAAGRASGGPARRRSDLGWDLPDLPGPRLWFARGPVMGVREADAFV